MCLCNDDLSSLFDNVLPESQIARSYFMSNLSYAINFGLAQPDKSLLIENIN